MRGDYYLWRDDNRLHIWSRDGYDGWDQSIWADGSPATASPLDATPSGVGLPQEIVDELVAMRLAQMVEERLLTVTIQRALDKHGGNFGCSALQQLGTAIIDALDGVDRR